MHFSISILIYSTITCLFVSLTNGQSINETDKQLLFSSFIKKFNKNYPDQNECNLRFQVFKSSLDRITKLNSLRKSNTDAIYGINSYSDLTPMEFKLKMINDQVNLKQQQINVESKQNDLLNQIKSTNEDELKKDNYQQHENKNKVNKFRARPINHQESSIELTKFDKFIETYLSLQFGEDINLPKFSAEQFINLFTASLTESNSTESNLFTTTAKQVRTKRDANNYLNEYDEILPQTYPRKLDWRDSNVISEVDNQGACGACWAHSTLQTIESMAAIKYSFPVGKRLSVQQLIDCSSNNYGCLGGDTCAVLSWIASNRIKIASAKAYPLRGNSGECRIKNEQIASGFTVFGNFTCTNFSNNEIELVKLLYNHGPVATTADATLWQDYLGGTIQFNCGNEANHAVQIVGYNLETEIPYYIVRNTWGINFGINGYLHVAIGGNLCALEERVSALDVEMI